MLPTMKTPVKHSLSDLTVLAYGPTKIGKSTWCSNFDNALFLATEPGLNSLEVHQVQVTTWTEFLEYLGEIGAGKHEFKTVIIDTIDNAYKMCQEYMMHKYSVEHESDLKFGKGFTLVNNEFQRVITKLAFLPYGLVLISHSQELELETRTGTKYNRAVPTLPDKARKIVLGLVDMVLYCDIDSNTDTETGKTLVRRVMRTKPSIYFEAGDRTGKLPETIGLDYDEFLEAYLTGTPKTKAAKPATTKNEEKKVA